MHISWLGGTCIKLLIKHLSEEVGVIIDPYQPKQGSFPRSLGARLALFSAGQTGAVTLTQQPFIIDTPGEFEIQETIILASPANGENLIFKIVAEGMSLVHLGRLTKPFETAWLEKIGHVDVLLVPVGNGKDYLPLTEAAALVTELEPRIVIPVAYQCDTHPGARPVSEFIKELGVKPAATDQKIFLKKKDLPAEEMRLLVLEKT